MIFCLSKVSSPSWDKRFWTIKGLQKELEIELCSICFVEDLPENYIDISNLDKIVELLATPCGAEYMVNTITALLLNLNYKWSKNK